MLLNCGLGEDSWESLGLQGERTANPKGNQPWIFIGRTDAEAETPILWQPDAKNWLLGKDPDAGKDWRQEEKGTTEDEMVGWHHRLKGHEFEQAPGIGDGQGSLSCCSPWGCKELNMTEWLNWTDGSHRCFGGITQEIKTRLSKNEATLIPCKELRVPACEVPSVMSVFLQPCGL